MRRLRVVATMLALLAAGCGGGGGGGSGGETTSSAPVASTVPSTTAGTTIPPTALSLHLTDLHLVNAADSDNGVRVLLPAGVTTASVTLTGVPSPNQVVSVCQTRELDHPLTTAVCRMPANGEAVTVALGSAASGVEIVQVGAPSGGPAAGAITLDDVTVRYAASTRDVSVRLPQIASGDSAGRPAFSLTPAGATGNFSATLTWTVIQAFGGSPSSGTLELVQAGNVAKHADSGGQQVQLNGTVPTPVGDAAIRVQNVGASAMISPKLIMVLP